MAEAVALFDTNVLPQSGDLSTPFWLSIRRLCEARSIKPCIPELVLHESFNLRREAYDEAASRFVSSFNQISRFFDAPPVYVPDVDEICQQWEEELRAKLHVMALHGDDAVAALTREAARRAPASKGRGARDSAIWLTALRLAAGGTEVLLVSRNTADFARGPGPSAELHPQLASEAAEVTGNICYFSSLDDFIDHIAVKTPPPTLDLPLLTELLTPAIVQAAALAVPGVDLPGDLFSAEELSAAEVTLDSVRALRSYAIGEDGLALIDGNGCLMLPDPDGEDSRIGFKLMAWLDFDLASQSPTSGEVHGLTMVVAPRSGPA